MNKLTAGLVLAVACLFAIPAGAQNGNNALSRRDLQSSGATDADIDQLNRTIARLTQETGENRAALEGIAAGILRAEANLPFDEYLRRLEDAAPRLRAALALADALQASAQAEGDTVSASLIASARTAINRGDLDGAEATLQQARALSATAVTRARLENARVAALQAQLKMLVFDFVGAARFYVEASEAAPVDQPIQRASYLGAGAQAYWAAYQEMGNLEAGSQSVRTYQAAAAINLPEEDRLRNFQLRSELCASQAILAGDGIYESGLTRRAALFAIERECSATAYDVMRDPTYSSTLMEVQIKRNRGTARSLLAIETRDTRHLRAAADDLVQARSGFEQLDDRLAAADASFELAQLSYEAASELNIDPQTNIAHAVDAARYGLNLIDARSNALLWRRGQHTLAIAYRYSASNGHPEHLTSSIQAFREALNALPEAQAPAPASRLWLGLALAYEIGADAGRREMRPQAIEAARTAKRLGQQTSDPQLVESADAILARLTSR